VTCTKCIRRLARFLVRNVHTGVETRMCRQCIMLDPEHMTVGIINGRN